VTANQRSDNDQNPIPGTPHRNIPAGNDDEATQEEAGNGNDGGDPEPHPGQNIVPVKALQKEGGDGSNLKVSQHFNARQATLARMATKNYKTVSTEKKPPDNNSPPANPDNDRGYDNYKRPSL